MEQCRDKDHSEILLAAHSQYQCFLEAKLQWTIMCTDHPAPWRTGNTLRAFASGGVGPGLGKRVLRMCGGSHEDFEVGSVRAVVLSQRESVCTRRHKTSARTPSGKPYTVSQSDVGCALIRLDQCRYRRNIGRDRYRKVVVLDFDVELWPTFELVLALRSEFNDSRGGWIVGSVDPAQTVRDVC